MGWIKKLKFGKIFPTYETVTIWRVVVKMKGTSDWYLTVESEEEMNKLFKVLSDLLGKRTVFTFSDLSIWMPDVSAVSTRPYTQRKRGDA